MTADDGKELGKTVDAMFGGQSGRVHYLIVSAGGLAGVGERLHRVDWRSAALKGDAITLSLSSAQFEALPEVPRDQWPIE